MLEGRYLFCMRYLLGVFSTFWGKKIYGSGHFSGSCADDHQLIFFIWPYVPQTKVDCIKIVLKYGILPSNLGFTEAQDALKFPAADVWVFSGKDRAFYRLPIG